jgi:hypothetical protein
LSTKLAILTLMARRNPKLKLLGSFVFIVELINDLVIDNVADILFFLTFSNFLLLI